MRFRMMLVWLVICFVWVPPLHGWAAPESSEVERLKENAPVHLELEVTVDRVERILNPDPMSPVQLRIFEGKVLKTMKLPSDSGLVVGSTLEVVYHYIPSWSQNQYTGGKPVDIRPGDLIEIWLVPDDEDGTDAWRPALGGYTIHHLKRIESRPDYIKEPLAHRLRAIDWLGGVMQAAYFTIIVGFIVYVFGLYQRFYS